MILSKTHGFAFVHIPKCAGTSVRRQIERFDETGGRFAGVTTHHELGRIDSMHLPTAVLRDHFPEDFAALRAVRSYAVTRDPHARFRSAVGQHLKNFKGQRLAEATEADVKATFDDVRRALDPRPDFLPFRYVHFTPQVDYTHLDGAPFVTERIALEHIDRLFEALARETGAEISPATSNQDVVLKDRRFERLVWTANDLARAILPSRGYQQLKRMAEPILVRREIPAGVERFFASTPVRAFVEDYYAKDIALHAADLARTRTPAAEVTG